MRSTSKMRKPCSVHFPGLTLKRLLLLAVLLSLPSVPAFGQTLLLTLDDPNPQAGALFGNLVAGVGDVSGDLVPDIAVVAFCQDSGANIDQGQVFVFSGADGSLLLTLDDPTPQAQTPDCLFGHSLAGVGDVNADLVPDIAVGSRRQDVGANVDQGQVFIFSGADGSVLRTLDDPTPQFSAWFGASLAGVGLVDADSVPDIAVGAPNHHVGTNNFQGQVFIISGADGSLLLTLDDPTPQASASFGNSLAGVGDVDGDSKPDVAVGAAFQDVGTNIDQGQVFVFSGADGSLLLTLDDPNPQAGANFSLEKSLAGVGDVNGDLVPDIAVAAIGQMVGGNNLQGQAFVFSGADGSLLLTLDDPTPQPGAFFGNSLAGLGDVDGDSKSDIAVGARLQSSGGKVFVFSGVDGSLLVTLDNPNPNPLGSGQFGRSVAGPGDVDGDSVPDVVVGAHAQDVGGNTNQGQAFVLAIVGESVLMVEIDVKPQSCPNPLNVRSKGVLPVAILGSEDFDVGMIDVASIRLAGVDPNRSSYEYVATPVSDGTGVLMAITLQEEPCVDGDCDEEPCVDGDCGEEPCVDGDCDGEPCVDGDCDDDPPCENGDCPDEDECECTEEDPDDYLDLTLKFETEDIVNALGDVNDGDLFVLTLTGELYDGTPIEGEDCIVVKKPKKIK